MKKFKQVAAALLSGLMLFSTMGCEFIPMGNSSISSGSESVSDDVHQHKTVHHTGITATCQNVGKLEHWECIICEKLFSDKDCTKEITKVDVSIAKQAHVLEKHDRVEATATANGNIEYYTCGVCDKYFADELGKSEIFVEDIDILFNKYASPVECIDFMVNVPENRNPIVLQLADPQLIDSSQKRDDVNLSQEKIDAWGPETREERCYKYIRELVETTKPDLVLISGDVIYGRYDDNGSVLLDFVKFMEGLDVAWAPIMGNHDVESNMGADWMCEQYEKAPNCLFKQGDIMGNGNYTIGIRQGEEVKRVIVNMDTNGCTGASEMSKANGQTVTHQNNGYDITLGTYGLQPDQVEWFETTIAKIKESAPEVKISFHIHIAMKYFVVAYCKESERGV